MAKKEDIKNVAIYLRASRDEENKGIEEALQSQRMLLTEMCETRGWKYTIYEEIASSVTMQRSQLNSMLEGVEQGKYDAVVVKDIDRLSRDEFDSSDIKRILYRSDTAIATPPNTIYDWTNRQDMLLLNIKTFLSAQEYEIIRERLMYGKLSASKRGFWAHGTPPLGYKKNLETRKLEPDENMVKHVHYIFNSIVEGKSVSEVRQELNKYGVKTKEGKKFSFNSIFRIINNEAYKGTLVYNRYKVTDERRRDGKRKKTIELPKDEWERIEDAHPAIIDKATWEKANEIVNTYSFAKKRKSSTTYPTSRFTYCGTCGGTLTFQVAHTGKLYLKHCLKCGNRTYQYKPILEGIRAELMPFHQELIDSITALEKTGKDANIEYKKEQLEKRIKSVELGIQRLLPAYQETVITLDEFKTAKAQGEEELKQLHFELDELNKLDPQEQIIGLQELKKQVEQLFGKWHRLDDEGLSDEDLNKALNIIIEKVIWTYPKGEGVEPKLHVQFRM
ncbi:recombinase family protein [Bacillus wiedmannii]|uniref:Recombinase family protein n=1 Tax=Bacillus wiedmannii TaxID=1890302 RepID=A0AA95RWK6_9BACI|nr:recombinase family protein [Bacillus wiedmannii]WHY28121.1 recombinase family protein [Bacillus wiedmannii]